MADLSSHPTRILMFVAFLLTAEMAGRIGSEQTGSAPGRMKLYEGEYMVTGGGEDETATSSNLPVNSFRETWTMWRAENGYFEVEGDRVYESADSVFHNSKFSARLSPTKRLLSVTDYGKLRFQKDSGPLTCDFHAMDVHCTSNAKDPSDSVDVRLPLDHPAGLFTPLSPLSWSSVTRGMTMNSSELKQVQMISIREVSARDPVALEVFDGAVRYIHSEDFTTAGRTWRADRFEVKLPLHPKSTVWTSPEGILLAVSFGGGEGEGLRLQTFRSLVSPEMLTTSDKR